MRRAIGVTVRYIKGEGMNCREFIEELSDYLNGEGSQGVREAIEEHAAFCRKCRVIHDSTRKTLEIVTEAGAATYSLPDSVSERLRMRVRAQLTIKQTRRKPVPAGHHSNDPRETPS